MKLYSKRLHFRFSSDIVGTKGDIVAVAVLVDVDDSTKAEFDGHAAVTESVAVQTATETKSLLAEFMTWLWVS